MTDPYEVLGVSRNADNDEIKRAYRALSRKYHPDANIDNPDKEGAEARFKEVQTAYKQIMDERERGSYYSGFGGQESFDNEDDLRLRAAYNYISSGSFSEALNVLEQIGIRKAYWYYLSAMANSGAGNNVKALEHASEAVRLEPGNASYSMLKARLESGGAWYQQRGTSYGMPTMDFSDVCWKLICANLACNCFCPGACCFI